MEERTAAVPREGEVSKGEGKSTKEQAFVLAGRCGMPYRALKLGSLATAAFYNVLHADLGVANLLLVLPRNRSGGAISAAVAVHIAVRIAIG